MGLISWLLGNSKKDSNELSDELSIQKELENWETFYDYGEIWDAYLKHMHRIEKEWSKLTKSKAFISDAAIDFEQYCEKNISEAHRIYELEKSRKSPSPPNMPVFTRLAMLYEKQERYDDAIRVCADALKIGTININMPNRLLRMIKKAGREPTKYELNLVNKSKKALEDRRNRNKE